MKLDRDEFIVRDRHGLELLTAALSEGFGPGAAFPVQLLYRPWTVNKNGQVNRFGRNEFEANPSNLLTFCHFPSRALIFYWMF